MHYKSKSVFNTSLQGGASKLVLALAVLGLITSCGSKSGDEKASQSIVSVNGDEITVLQLNNELQRANVQPNQQDAASKQLVGALVDRQILMQAAHKNRIDREPRVMQALENSKSQILAQAYLESKVSAVAKPTDAEIAEYRTKHANIFADRKVYIMDELGFQFDPKNQQGLQALSESAKTLEEVAQWLNANQVKFATKRASIAAETVPPQLLDKLSKMVVGDLVFINGNGGSVAARLLEIKDAAISEKDSKPLIERLILEQKRKQVAEDEMKRLRAESKIEYLNKKFEPTVASAENKPAQPAAPAPATEPAKPATKGKDSHIEKGLSGL